MSKITAKEYGEMTSQASPGSRVLRNCTIAFLVGGLICAVGQGLYEIYTSLGMENDTAPTLVSVTLIFCSAVLTGLGWYHKIAKHAGAGTLVPITGFANAVVSPAIEFRDEGLILGLAAKLFSISGPVIVYGLFSSVVYGVIWYIITLIR